MLWSDGKIRSDNYQGTDLYQALRKYTTEQLDDEILRLKWENEYLRLVMSRGPQNEETEMAKSATAAA